MWNPDRCLRLVLIVGALAAQAGCAGDRKTVSTPGEVGGTLVIASPAEPEILLPPLAETLPAKQVVEQLFDFLADLPESMSTIGDVGFRPRLAQRWTWSPDSTSVEFTLVNNALFHDGRPITAQDVKFSYELYSDPQVASTHASSLPAVDSIVVADSSTVRFHFADRNPERFFRLVYNLAVLPAHAFEGVDRTKLAESVLATAPIGSGPFQLARWDRGTLLEVTANPSYHRGRPSLDRIVWRIGGDYSTAARSVMAGESDLVEVVRPEVMQQLKADASVRAVEYPTYEHGYLLFNTRSPNNRKQPHPLFGNVRVRRALAMAIDRPAVVRNAYDSLASLSYGPFTRALWSADTSIAQLPYSVEQARQLLDSAGWRDVNGDGVRERNGRSLTFALLVPSVSAPRQRMAVVLQEQLRAVGADARIESAEPPSLGPRLGAGKFDAYIHTWHLDPSPASIEQTWGSRDLERSANFGWYSNPRVDSLIEAAKAEKDLGRAKTAYRHVYELIVSEAPAVFIWEPRNFALVSKRFRFEGLRGDAWWAHLASWYVPASERIPRDKAGR
jgi:peptide/nickel transport system substrate-binding protein